MLCVLSSVSGQSPTVNPTQAPTPEPLVDSDGRGEVRLQAFFGDHSKRDCEQGASSVDLVGRGDGHNCLRGSNVRQEDGLQVGGNSGSWRGKKYSARVLCGGKSDAVYFEVYRNNHCSTKAEGGYDAEMVDYIKIRKATDEGYCWHVRTKNSDAHDEYKGMAGLDPGLDPIPANKTFEGRASYIVHGCSAYRMRASLLTYLFRDGPSRPLNALSDYFSRWFYNHTSDSTSTAGRA